MFVELLFEFCFLTETASLEYILTKGLRTMRKGMLRGEYIFINKCCVLGIIFEVIHVMPRRNGLLCKYAIRHVYATHLQINMQINKLCVK